MAWTSDTTGSIIASSKGGAVVSRLCKLIETLLRLPPEAKFRDVEKVLAEFGWELKRTSGSHNIFRDAKGRMLTVPTVKGRTVKTTYLKQVVELLELEEYHEQNC